MSFVCTKCRMTMSAIGDPTDVIPKASTCRGYMDNNPLIMSENDHYPCPNSQRIATPCDWRKVVIGTIAIIAIGVYFGLL